MFVLFCKIKNIINLSDNSKWLIVLVESHIAGRHFEVRMVDVEVGIVDIGQQDDVGIS